MKYYGRYLIFAVIAAYVQFLTPRYVSDQVTVLDLLKGLSLGGLLMHGYFLSYVTMMFPMILLQLSFSVYIYQHYSNSSVYYFTRQSSRLRWYTRECVHLFSYVFLYTTILLLSSFAIAVIHGDLIWDTAGTRLIPFFVYSFSVWNFAMLLLINILAIKLGSYIAFFLVFASQCLQIGLFNFIDEYNIGNAVYVTEKSRYFINRIPFAHIILEWHGSENPLINQDINMFGIHLEFHSTILLFAVISIIIFGIGAYIVAQHDILQADLEVNT